ncbi:hypothetical protein CU097_000551, partial [Rhizopus azygosporus]
MSSDCILSDPNCRARDFRENIEISILSPITMENSLWGGSSVVSAKKVLHSESILRLD